VRYPRARGESTRDFGNRVVGYAEEHEVGTVVAQGDVPLAQAGRNCRPDAAGADDLNRFERL
jgi:hypothetical protein